MSTGFEGGGTGNGFPGSGGAPEGLTVTDGIRIVPVRIGGGELHRVPNTVRDAGVDAINEWLATQAAAGTSEAAPAALSTTETRADELEAAGGVPAAIDRVRASLTQPSGAGVARFGPVQGPTTTEPPRLARPYVLAGGPSGDGSTRSAETAAATVDVPDAEPTPEGLLAAEAAGAGHDTAEPHTYAGRLVGESPPRTLTSAEPVRHKRLRHGPRLGRLSLNPLSHLRAAVAMRQEKIQDATNSTLQEEMIRRHGIDFLADATPEERNLVLAEAWKGLRGWKGAVERYKIGRVAQEKAWASLSPNERDMYKLADRAGLAILIAGGAILASRYGRQVAEWAGGLWDSIVPDIQPLFNNPNVAPAHPGTPSVPPHPLPGPEATPTPDSGPRTGQVGTGADLGPSPEDRTVDHNMGANELFADNDIGGSERDRANLAADQTTIDWAIGRGIGYEDAEGNLGLKEFDANGQRVTLTPQDIAWLNARSDALVAAR
jgi:hypothetical protein